MVGELQQQYVQPVQQPVEEKLAWYEDWSWSGILEKTGIGAIFAGLTGWILSSSDVARKGLNKLTSGVEDRGWGDNLKDTLHDAPVAWFKKTFTSSELPAADIISEEVTVGGNIKLPQPVPYWQNAEILVSPNRLDKLVDLRNSLKEAGRGGSNMGAELRDIEGLREETVQFVRNAEAWDENLKKYKNAKDAANSYYGGSLEIPTFNISNEVDAAFKAKKDSKGNSLTIPQELDTYGRTKNNKKWDKLSTLERVLYLDSQLSTTTEPKDLWNTETKDSSMWHTVGFEKGGNNEASNEQLVTAGVIGGYAGGAIGAGVGGVFGAGIGAVPGAVGGATLGTGAAVGLTAAYKGLLGWDLMENTERDAKDKIRADIESGNIARARGRANAAVKWYDELIENSKGTATEMEKDGNARTDFINILAYIDEIDKRKQLLPLLETTYSVIKDNAVNASRDMEDFSKQIAVFKQIDEGKKQQTAEKGEPNEQEKLAAKQKQLADAEVAKKAAEEAAKKNPPVTPVTPDCTVDANKSLAGCTK